MWCDDPRRIHRQPRYRFLSSFKGSLVVDFEPKCCVFAHECFSRVCPSSGRRVATSSAAHHSLFGRNMTSVLIHRMEATRPNAKFENCNVSKLRNVACTPPDVLPLSTPPPFFLFGLVTDVRKTDEDAAQNAANRLCLTVRLWVGPAIGRDTFEALPNGRSTICGCLGSR